MSVDRSIGTSANGLDTARALAFLGGDADLFREVLQTFMTEAPQELEAFQASIHSQARPGVLKYLHRAAPTLAIIATEELAEEARTVYETLLTTTDPLEGFLPRLSALAQRMEQLLAQVRTQIG